MTHIKHHNQYIPIMDIQQLEKEFFSVSNVNHILSITKERNDGIDMKLVIAGMIRAFTFTIKEAYIPTSIGCINSSACFFAQCEFSRTIEMAPCW